MDRSLTGPGIKLDYLCIKDEIVQWYANDGYQGYQQPLPFHWDKKQLVQDDHNAQREQCLRLRGHHTHHPQSMKQ